MAKPQQLNKRGKRLLGATALAAAIWWGLPIVPFVFTRCNLEREDFFNSRDHISFFGASSPEAAASSFINYWVDQPMLCLGLWDGEDELHADLPEWVDFRLPLKNTPYFFWLVDETVEVKEKRLLPDWNGTAWYMVVQGSSNTGFKLRFSCIVHKSKFGRRWQIHYPELEKVVRSRAVEYE